MKRWMTALVTLAMTVMNTGCAPVVLDPLAQDQVVQQEPGEGGSATPASTNVIAILAKDVPAAESGSPNEILTNGPGSPHDPDSLLLMFSNQPEPCADPQI